MSLFVLMFFFFFFKQKTAYEMRISDWSSDVCSSDLLDVEPVLANGRRPDFRLRFNVSASAADLERGFRQSIFGNLAKQHSGLVMDAKFRTRWKHGELADMLKLLVDTKDYGQDGDRVFILHPAKGAVEHRTSPLIWGRDCNYGQDHPTGDRKSTRLNSSH